MADHFPLQANLHHLTTRGDRSKPTRQYGRASPGWHYWAMGVVTVATCQFPVGAGIQANLGGTLISDPRSDDRTTR